MFKKVIMCFLVTALVAGAFTACSSSTTETNTQDPISASSESPSVSSETKQADQKLVGVVLATQTNPWIKVFADTIEQKCKEYGWDYRIYDSGWDSQEELKALEDLIALQADLIIFDPVDSQACKAGLEAVANAGIPAVAVNGAVDKDFAPVVTSVQCPNLENGVEVGKWLIQSVIKDGEIKAAVLSGEMGSEIGRLRRTGLFAGIIQAKAELNGQTMSSDDAMKVAEDMDNQLTTTGKAYNADSKFELVQQGYGSWSAEGGLNHMNDILIAHPYVNVLLTENDTMAIGGMNAIEEAGLSGKITIAAACDAQKEALEKIMEGTYGATGLNLPDLIALKGVEVAHQILEEGADVNSFPKIIYTDAVSITAENVDQYYNPDSVF